MEWTRENAEVPSKEVERMPDDPGYTTAHPCDTVDHVAAKSTHDKRPLDIFKAPAYVFARCFGRPTETERTGAKVPKNKEHVFPQLEEKLCSSTHSLGGPIRRGDSRGVRIWNRARRKARPLHSPAPPPAGSIRRTGSRCAGQVVAAVVLFGTAAVRSSFPHSGGSYDHTPT